MFKPKMKKSDFDLKLKLNGKVDLGIKIDQSFTWNEHVNDVAIKLTQSNAML